MLLTEKDLLDEQIYHNDKRYLTNRFLHGIGIAGGMTIVPIDDHNISLESGIAIDNSGREIVVEKSRIIKMDRIDGFVYPSDSTHADKVYLCIRYNETNSNPINIYDSTDVQSEECFTKISEGYRLFLTKRPLDYKNNTPDYFKGHDYIIYTDKDITVIQRMPLFVSAGKPFKVMFFVECHTANTSFELDLVENLSCLSYENKEDFSICIKNVFDESNECKIFTYDIDAFNIDNGHAEMRVHEGKSHVIINGQRKELHFSHSAKTEITSKDLYDKTADKYYLDFISGSGSFTSNEDLYLASLDIIGSDNEYKIVNVQNNPFDQRVYSQFLIRGFIDKLKNELAEVRNIQLIQNDTLQSNKKPESVQKISTGEYTFTTSLGAKEGQRFISDEIVHGLGLGPVSIQLSIENENNQLFGSTEIFEDFPFMAETAAMVDISKGSFRIGVRMLNVTAIPEFTIHWTAFMDTSERSEAVKEKRIRIIPDKLELKVLQNYYLKAETDNLLGATILWEVNSPNGGTISRDGLYTAPDIPGVYEISAFCQDKPEIKDTIFIIVRD